MDEYLTNNSELLQADYLNTHAIMGLLDMARNHRGQVMYEEVIGSKGYSPWLPSQEDDSDIIRPKGWVAPQVVDHVDELSQAKDGLANFLGVMVRQYEAGGDQPVNTSRSWAETDLNSVGKSRRAVYGVFNNSFERIWKNAEGQELPLVPYLGYQTDRSQPDRDKLPGSKAKPDFIHFGTRSKEINDPTFSGSVRVYINPTIEQTASTAARICDKFCQQMGYVPRGKFVEDATSTNFEMRNDRLMFWAHSPEELTILLRATGEVANNEPAVFDDREPILLGMPVMQNGIELPTVRLTQDPSTELEQLVSQPSFNSSRIPLINKALAQVFQQDSSNTSEKEIPAFIAALQEVSTQAGVNEQDFNFNADQDMAIIRAALAAA